MTTTTILHPAAKVGPRRYSTETSTLPDGTKVHALRNSKGDMYAHLHAIRTPMSLPIPCGHFLEAVMPSGKPMTARDTDRDLTCRVRFAVKRGVPTRIGILEQSWHMAGLLVGDCPECMAHGAGLTDDEVDTFLALLSDEVVNGNEDGWARLVKMQELLDVVLSLRPVA
jgi:hypothetical protein